MGVFDWILGNENTKQSQNASSSVNTTKNASEFQENTQTNTGTTNAAGTSTGSGTTTQQQQQQQQQTAQTTQTGFDQNVLNAVNMLVANKATGGINPISDSTRDIVGANTALASSMAERASGADTFYKTMIEAQKAEEMRRFEKGTMGQINQAKDATGSANNSFSMLLENEGRADLATRLAALGMQGEASGRAAGTQELTAAIAALSEAANQGKSVDSASLAGEQSLAQLLTALKGGQISSTQEVDTTSAATANTQTEQEQQTAQLTEVLNTLLQQGTKQSSEITQSDSTTSGQTTGSKSGSLGDMLTAIAAFKD